DGPGAHVLDAGNAQHSVLDRDRDLPLNFFGGPAGVDGDDLHHLRRDVRVGIDRLVPKRPNPQGDDSQGQEQHDPAQAHGSLNEKVHPLFPPPFSLTLTVEGTEAGACRARTTIGFNKTAPLPSTRSPAFSPVSSSTFLPRNSPVSTSVICQVPGSVPRR